MSVRGQTPPLSLGRSALEQAPAAAAKPEPAPEKPSGFSLRNAFSMFLGKKGGGSGTYSDYADKKEDSAAGSSCGEVMGDAPNAFYQEQGVPEVLLAYGERAVGAKEGEGGEEVTVASPLGSSLDRLPGLVLPTPEDGLYRGPGEMGFSRSAMNLQSPEPVSPVPEPPASLDALSMPPISDAPATAPPSNTTTLVTPVTAPATGRVSESPMYDRVAIARAMALAADGSEIGGDGDSDFMVPNGSAWPSARRDMLGAMSPMSDLTSRSSSDGVDG
ncbi:unnamed protein product [Laminaria digitata]